MILSSDIDNSIRIETAYNLRFICKELDGNYIKRNLLRTIESHLREENNIIKAEVLISVMRIFKKIYDDSNAQFINFFMERLSNFIDTNNNYNLSFEVFLALISEYFDSLKEYINSGLMSSKNTPGTKNSGIIMLNLDTTKFSFYKVFKKFMKVKIY